MSVKLLNRLEDDMTELDTANRIVAALETAPPVTSKAAESASPIGSSAHR